MKVYYELFNRISNPENLFAAWDEFRRGKTSKKDVMEFEWKLEENIFNLHEELESKTYQHSSYTSFYIHDPKQRHIHKAEVRDRVLHHAIFSVLNPLFEETFIANSFSCRVGKGTHEGVNELYSMLRRVSSNGYKPCFALKCDIQKFFDSVNHGILLDIIKRRIKDDDVLHLLGQIIESYITKRSTLFDRRGIPIGNLTSQLFANVYMNEFDQYIKHRLKVKNYVRYTDDFVIVSGDQDYLKGLIAPINDFLKSELDLNLHPNKVKICKFSQGIDFLGYVLRPHCRTVRTKTSRRAFRKIRQRVSEYKKGSLTNEKLIQTVNSYLGVFSHAKTHRLSEDLKNQYWFWLSE